ncbi:MAG: hypothetical protein ACK5V2_07685 [Pseudomonadota bacterium]
MAKPARVQAAIPPFRPSGPLDSWRGESPGRHVAPTPSAGTAPQPTRPGAPGRRIRVELITADGCRGRFVVRLGAGGQPLHAHTTWDRPADRETIWATFDLLESAGGRFRVSESVRVDGDAWRHLEDTGQVEALCVDVLCDDKALSGAICGRLSAAEARSPRLQAGEG